MFYMFFLPQFSGSWTVTQPQSIGLKLGHAFALLLTKSKSQGFRAIFPRQHQQVKHGKIIAASWKNRNQREQVFVWPKKEKDFTKPNSVVRNIDYTVSKCSNAM